MLLALGDEVKRPKRSNTGLWDEEILCDECESHFAEIDGYAFEHLIGDRKRFFVCRDKSGDLILDGIIPLITYTHASVRKLTAFAISVLWRASVSDRPEMKGVKSANEERFLFCLKNKEFAEFELGLCRDTNPAWKGFVCVVGNWEIDGAHVERFSAGGYMFLIRRKASERPKSLWVLFDRYQGYQVAMCRSELESAFAVQMAGAARKARNAYGDPWRGLRKEKSNG
jgi:hypothetical protein